MRYAVDMQNLPAIPTVGLILIASPRAIRRDLGTALTVQLALVAPLQVLDGGNSFDGLKLARELRRQTRAYHPALSRVLVARAFTCYQMVTLLANTAPDGTPTLVMDLLETFYDENIAFPERQRLLDQALQQLARLSQLAPVFVSAEAEDEPLFRALEEGVDHQWRFEVPAAVVQPRLF